MTMLLNRKRRKAQSIFFLYQSIWLSSLTFHCGHKLILSICVGTQNSVELFQGLTLGKVLDLKVWKCLILFHPGKTKIYIKFITCDMMRYVNFLFYVHYPLKLTLPCIILILQYWIYFLVRTKTLHCHLCLTKFLSQTWCCALACILYSK